MSTPTITQYMPPRARVELFWRIMRPKRKVARLESFRRFLQKLLP
jgi:hypothetical protein